MKLFKKIFCIALIAFSVCMLLLLLYAGCYYLKYQETDKYKDYEIIDKHLTWTKSSGPYWNTYKDKIDTTGPLLHEHYTYKKISGESEENLIGAWYMFDLMEIIFSDTKHQGTCVLVNPEYELDVWNDWTVNKIEVYEIVEIKYDRDSETRYDPAQTQINVICQTEDSDMFSEFKGIIMTDQEKSHYSPYGEPKSYYLRVSFDESDAIVWDAQLYVYLNERGGVADVYMDNAQFIIKDGEECPEKIIKIPNSSKLFELIAGAFPRQSK